MIIIGEKINASRKSISRAIINRDEDTIKQQIEAQDKAGAVYIDLNAGTGSGDEQKEIEHMCWLIDLALETTEKKFSIDSANPTIIQKGVEHLNGRRDFLVNSVKNDKKILDAVFPVIQENSMPVICLAMGTEGIPKDAEERTQVCKEIYEHAMKAGVKEENLLFDPLVIPLSANTSYEKIALATLRKIKEELPNSKTSMGISNVSIGLPKRTRINEALLTAAITHGLDAAICDPTKDGVRKAILLGKLIAGRDKYCRSYTRAVRKGEFGPQKKKK
ncbi:dihydropteroate synthase [bacterium]|nr:dihydropteroate synthase [bacterium]